MQKNLSFEYIETKELKIFSFYDLLFFFPFRYVDRSKFYSIREITVFDVEIQVIGNLFD